MSDLRTAAQQALEAWDNDENGTMDHPLSGVMEALRAALEKPDADAPERRCGGPGCDMKCCQPVEEPVACPHRDEPRGCYRVRCQLGRKCVEPLYTHPPRREWRGLKEWEINDGLDQLPTEDVCSWSFRQGVYFAEKALKERNA